MSDKGRPLPKFGEWDVNDPASAEGFTVIFNKARDEKKTGGKPGSPGKSSEGHVKSGGGDPSKPQPVKKMALLHASSSCGLLTDTKMDLLAAKKKVTVLTHLKAMVLFMFYCRLS
ncbi:RPM1-interacting protein 4 (RIN4) family protein [Arabidopsis thaliana]|uniref:Isoform 2 of Protein NOI4 n=1 Tax=Arabidopsis thaliana TaxID=3702 RepID=O22633-2|nr:RPM1-interacting protein 4 (RIN4) family protein [Arabidopsis thaliana]AED96687.1 RPM1-interacting protein 4 (RIN4) family protein [Arabidopsis thaliana]|eukprot:NP_200396.2 RPM1-interacting protein 4 (RIN4) family protein [Arabidopsis thaliana]